MIFGLAGELLEQFNLVQRVALLLVQHALAALGLTPQSPVRRDELLSRLTSARLRRHVHYVTQLLARERHVLPLQRAFLRARRPREPLVEVESTVRASAQ